MAGNIELLRTKAEDFDKIVHFARQKLSQLFDLGTAEASLKQVSELLEYYAQFCSAHSKPDQEQKFLWLARILRKISEETA